jgi:hypothetical protein
VRQIRQMRNTLNFGWTTSPSRVYTAGPNKPNVYSRFLLKDRERSTAGVDVVWLSLFSVSVIAQHTFIEAIQFNELLELLIVLQSWFGRAGATDSLLLTQPVAGVPTQLNHSLEVGAS